MDTPTEAELLARARTGDATAVAALVEQHQAQVVRFARRLCPRDADDVAQETLLAMTRGLRDFRGGASLSTWLFTIARNACHRQHRGLTPTTSLDDAASAIDPQPRPDDVAATAETGAALERALTSLEEGQREVLLLRDGEGLSADEVAQVMGLTVAAVKSRLHRARLAVRERLLPVLGAAPGAPRKAGCPDVLEALSRHLEGELADDLCRTLEAHLASCPDCAQACDSLKRAIALCRHPAGDVQVPETIRLVLRQALADLARDCA